MGFLFAHAFLTQSQPWTMSGWLSSTLPSQEKQAPCLLFPASQVLAPFEVTNSEAVS